MKLFAMPYIHNAVQPVESIETEGAEIKQISN
jgi:hypothetical protein